MKFVNGYKRLILWSGFMYSDEDLEQAVKQGIFTQSAVRDFRQQFTRDKKPVVDEEKFRLIT